MICLPDALRRMKDPTAAPCHPCILAALRNPLGEALATIKEQFEAELEGRKDDELRTLPTWTRPTNPRLNRIKNRARTLRRAAARGRQS